MPRDFAAFRLITLPLLGPALVSSFLISFVTSFDEFAIASFLAPSGQPTYPVFLYASARTPALLPQVIAIGTLVIAVSHRCWCCSPRAAGGGPSGGWSATRATSPTTWPRGPGRGHR